MDDAADPQPPADHPTEDAASLAAEGPDTEANFPADAGDVDLLPESVIPGTELDDAVLQYFDEVDDEILEAVAEDLGLDHHSPEAICRGLIDRIVTEENINRLAEALDDLIPTGPAEPIDGVVLRFLADRLLTELAEQAKAAFS